MSAKNVTLMFLLLSAFGNVLARGEERVGNYLIAPGDSASEVKKKLGQPDEELTYVNAYNAPIAKGWVYHKYRVCLLMRQSAVASVGCPDL